MGICGQLTNSIYFLSPVRVLVRALTSESKASTNVESRTAKWIYLYNSINVYENNRQSATVQSHKTIAKSRQFHRNYGILQAAVSAENPGGEIHEKKLETSECDDLFYVLAAIFFA